jgi:predicted nucleic acid-binding protein
LQNIFKKVYIPKAVFQELLYDDDNVQKMILDDKLFHIKDINDIESLQLLDGVLDKGESEAIILSKESNLTLLIDEKKGRNIAKSMGLKVIGLLGLLLINAKKGYISKNETVEILENIKDLNFRISTRLHVQFMEKLQTIKD